LHIESGSWLNGEFEYFFWINVGADARGYGLIGVSSKIRGRVLGHTAWDIKFVGQAIAPSKVENHDRTND
jgi:hypothetical protein